MSKKSEVVKPESENNNSETEIEKPESEQIEKPDEQTSDSTPLDQIANTLAESMPDVQQHAIDQEQANVEAQNAEWSEYRDTDGNPFDADIHKTNKEGEPTLSPKGKLIKKPGRKKGSATKNGQSVIGVKTEQKQSPEQAAAVQARASGTMAANLLMTLGVVVGGDEWHPVKDVNTGMDEKLMLETAFADYFEATGKTDIPPGMALTAAIGGYMLPRFTMPKTQSRMQKLKGWFVKKIADRKLRKHGMKAEKVDNKE